MPTEPELSPDVSAVETMLKQFAPTDSSLNRDSVMYQAGFAAAASSQVKSHWIWPTTTAALAASLLFLLAFPLASTPRQASSEAESLLEPVATQNAPAVKSEFVRAAPVPKRWFSKAPMLVMRERALRGDFGDRDTEADPEKWCSPAAFTSRQLLQEFLPALPEPSLGGNS